MRGQCGVGSAAERYRRIESPREYGGGGVVINSERAVGFEVFRYKIAAKPNSL